MTNSKLNTRTGCAIAAILCFAASPTLAQVLISEGFESGLGAWTQLHQAGSDGGFASQTGTTSPINGLLVPAPAQGLRAAMTDSAAGGSHVLYQDIFIPTIVPAASISFSLALVNRAPAYFTPAHLDWAATSTTGSLTLNQQARVDILSASSDPFSVNTADVLLNLFMTTSSTPLESGYMQIDTDITAFLQAHAGETLRLRFAEVDNVNIFNLGVDNITLAVPAPSTAAIVLGLTGLAARRRVR